MDASLSPEILPPFRAHEDKLRKEAELERYVELAARKLEGKGGILILMVYCRLAVDPWQTGSPC